MGTYDNLIFPISKRSDFLDMSQVKLWQCILKNYKIGDVVPSFQNQTNYNIALMEGGFANIRNLIYTGVSEMDDNTVLTVDKWGKDWTSTNYEDFYKSLGI